MNEKRRLVIAAAAVAAMVVLVAVLAYQQRPQTNASGADTAWLPGLKERLGEIRKIRLQSSLESTTLALRDGVWRVEERAGYPADFKRLEELLGTLAAARRVEPKTARPEYFERLGLTDVEQPDSDAVQIDIWFDGEEPGVQALVGKEAEGRGGRYVREAAATQTWLIDKSPDPVSGPADWLDRRLLAIDFSRVAAVSRALGGKPEFRARRPGKEVENLALDALPAGKAPRYASVFDAAARAPLSAELEDVRPFAEVDFAAAAVTEIALFEGLSITVRAIKDKDGGWIVAHAAAAPHASGADDPLRAEADALNARLDGWAFKVSDYAYGELAKPLAEYLQEEPSAAAAAPATEASDADDKR